MSLEKSESESVRSSASVTGPALTEAGDVVGDAIRSFLVVVGDCGKKLCGF